MSWHRNANIFRGFLYSHMTKKYSAKLILASCM